MNRSTPLVAFALAAFATAGCRSEGRPSTDSVAVAVTPGTGATTLVNPQLADTALTPDRAGLPRVNTGKTTAAQAAPGATPAPMAKTVPGTLAATPPAAAPAQTPAPAATSGAASTAPAQPPAPAVAPTLASIMASLPFAPGERLEYQVKFGPISVGTATMETIGVENLRGTETVHTRFRVNGGMRFYRVNDLYESWFDPHTFSSMRFLQQIDEGSYEKERDYEIFPDRKQYTENGGAAQASVDQPLDDASFIYFMRTVPLEVGKTYTFDRYYRPDRNPVKITVLRKETIKVPAGTFNTIVVQPSIRTKGIFSEGGHAEVWFTDDSLRAVVQMKSQLKFGSLNLYLKSLKPGTR